MVIGVSGLLILSFIVHLLWWRIKVPIQSSRALLIIFAVVPVVVITVLLYFKFDFQITVPEAISLLLLYISCTLVYISLYSAIEQHSPTLSIITHIATHGENGCEEKCILQHIKLHEEINKRLIVMQQVGWVTDNNGNCLLTKRGRRIAYIFEIGASILGLQKGG